MNLRRVLPVGLGVTVLLVLAGIASRGRPLSSSGAQGPTAGFFDYVLTTVVIAAVIAFAIAVWAFFENIRGRRRFTPPQGRFRLLSSLASFALALLVIWLLHKSGFVNRIHHLHQPVPPASKLHGKVPPGARRNVRGAHIRWDEIALVLLLIAGTLVYMFMRRSRRALRPLVRLREREALALALDESLDDLRADPDLRRAIVAAYARMERALGAARSPRRPAEAPFEYVARMLTTLDASVASVERLTSLFEWAKFSQHEPDAAMRDEAIDALVAVREELRAPAAVAA